MCKIPYPESLSDLTSYLTDLDTIFKDNSDNLCGRDITEQICLLYAYYHYFNADPSALSDLLAGDTYEQGVFDLVSGIYIDKNSDSGEDIDVLCCYCTDNESDLESIPQILEGIVINKLFRSEERRRKIDTVLNEQEIILGKKNIKTKITLLTNLQLGNSFKKKICLDINQLKPSSKFKGNIEFDFVDGNDILSEILSIEKPCEYVEKGTIEIDSECNMLSYYDSILVNISAKSLQALYNQYGSIDKGLLAQNLRFYVKQKKIDNDIIKSIKENGNDFWFLNNGIIIVCDNYKIIPGEKKILLENFSIINGGQTTFLIGNTDFDDDFLLQCKIIKNTKDTETEKINFISKVAEATNSQKAIKQKDINANRPEQRELKRQLKDIGIFCQVKRGDRISKKLYPLPWQNTTNEEVGQLILSFMYLMPGTARNNKSTIFSDSSRYNLIFGKQYNPLLIKDLLAIKCAYNKWKSSIIKDSNITKNDPYIEKLVSYGIYFTVSLIGIISKLYYHEDYIDRIRLEIIPERKFKVLYKLDLDHQIFDDDIYNDNFDKLSFLFDYVYHSFYRPAFEKLSQIKGKDDFSNFTKLNSNFEKYVCKFVYELIDKTDPLSDFALAFGKKSIMHIQTNEEKLSNKKIIDINWSVESTKIESYSSRSSEEAIREKLVEFRKKAFRIFRIKPYEVFTNKQVDKIAEAAPRALEDLQALNVLSDYQIENFGKSTIDIINEILDDPCNFS